jgi:2-polyprenyl-3-methyl-5-hydroxy-6-metoxy-1,4-benzoquinol methylase
MHVAWKQDQCYGRHHCFDTRPVFSTGVDGHRDPRRRTCSLTTNPMELSQQIEIACDLCGGREHGVLFVKEGFRHVRCTSCGLVYVNPRLACHLDTQIASGTGNMAETRLTPRQRRRIQKEVAALEPHRRVNRILEIGAGSGWFLAEAGRARWETWAVEVNRKSLSFLELQGIDRIVAQSAEDFDAPEGSMDVVRVWDVIEHLQSPQRAMEKAHEVLRPGGAMFLATTNFASLSRMISGPEWVYINGADHIYLFEPATITRLLRERGFAQIRIRTRSFNMRRKMYFPEMELPARYPLLLPLRKIVDEAIKLTIYGHQMIVTAIKPDNV